MQTFRICRSSDTHTPLAVTITRVHIRLADEFRFLKIILQFKFYTIYSGGSRISHWGGVDPLGGANLRRVHFLAKMYVKMKEIDPVGGARRRRPLDPPMIYSAKSNQMACFRTEMTKQASLHKR